jgi:hypothetical protein
MTYILEDVVYELGDYYALKVETGFEVYKEGITHSVRCARIGWSGNKGKQKAIDEINRRILLAL